MSVNSLSQGLNVDVPKAGLEPQTSRSESRASTTTPRRHTQITDTWDINETVYLVLGIETVSDTYLRIAVSQQG
ncbi:hypothetical protein ElyMa_002191600 [Elysia marginata]|uniref:Uncharacterized protein n=1 Tax=Elysia marginata TaxID=1093978 RepID=A0AAV4FTB5_9GAST|nr:hypothetical protein ElyMa_002191600 [Elysia marginata]